MIELLAPGGNKVKMKTAFDYGADAVYIGGDVFGLRANADNFTLDEIAQSVDYANSINKKIYVTMNIIARSHDLPEMAKYAKELKKAGVHGVIISDPGAFLTVKEAEPDLPIHVSTQANNLNWKTCEFWHKMGAVRVNLARELTLPEIAEIRKKLDERNCGLELEAFVHGAMCMSFSGRCLLSNYFTERDANRGDCAQPCRWQYHLVEQKRPGQYFPISNDENGTYIMNSQDMCMIEHIPELVAAGVDSFKIEGRAKSAYYAAVATNAYRAAIDGYLKNPSPDYKPEQWIIDEVRKISYRDYCTGFYFGAPQENAHIYYDGIYIREWDIIANVDDSDGEFLTVTQRNRFFEGDELEVLMPSQKPFTIKVEEMYNEKGERIEVAPNPMAKIKIRCTENIPAGAVLRKERDD